MTKNIKWILIAAAIIYCGCSINNPMIYIDNEKSYPDPSVFNSEPCNWRIRESEYFVELEIDSLLEIQSPKSYTLTDRVVVSPIPKDYSILFLKVHAIEDYFHVNNPFFRVFFSEKYFVEEYSGIDDYGIKKSVEWYDSLKSLGRVPTQCEYLFLPIKKDSIKTIHKIIENKESVIVNEGRGSGDTIWASCYYNKEDVDFSWLLSFKQRVHILDSIKEVVLTQLGDSKNIEKNKGHGTRHFVPTKD